MKEMAIKKILFIINVDWFFASHFLQVGKEAISQGYEVHLACTVTDKKDELESMGFVVHEASISRSGTHVLQEIKTMYQIYKVMKSVRPDIANIFSKANIAGLPSCRENLPKVLFEATAYSQAVVATDCQSGYREILAPETNASFQLKENYELSEFGALAPIKNIKSSKKAMRLIIEDKETQKTYQIKAKKRVEDFKIEKISILYKDILCAD